MKNVPTKNTFKNGFNIDLINQNSKENPYAMGTRVLPM